MSRLKEGRLIRATRVIAIAIAFAVAMIACLGGCSASGRPFSEDLIREYQLTDEEIPLLQFELSGAMLLRRQVAEVERSVTEDHDLERVEDRFIDEIKFKDRTPGLAIDIGHPALHVAFEPKCGLVFEPGRDEAGTYELASASSPNEGEAVDPSRRSVPSSAACVGSINYCGEIYDIYTREAKIYLLVDESSLGTVIAQRRTVEGMRHESKSRRR